MEAGSGAGAPTVASTGPDLPVYCLSPAQKPLITCLLFAGAQVAWAGAGVGVRGGGKLRSAVTEGRCRGPLEQQDSDSSFIMLLSETTATQCHLPTDLPVCPKNSQKLTWPGRKLRGCVFLHTIWPCFRGGSCGRALDHLTCLQMSPCEQLTVVGNSLSAKHWALQIVCGGTRTSFQGKHKGVGGRGAAVLLVRTWVLKRTILEQGIKKSLSPGPAPLPASASRCTMKTMLWATDSVS